MGGGGSWLVLASLEANENSSSFAKTSPNQRSTIYFRKRRSHRRQDSLKETCEEVCFCLQKREEEVQGMCGRDIIWNRAVSTLLEGRALCQRKAHP